MFKPWPHQEVAVRQSVYLFEDNPHGHCFILQAPTGAGKTFIMTSLIHWAADNRHKVALYSHRKQLINQLGRDLQKQGLSYGVQSAEFPELYAPGRSIQVCSLQTVDSRVLKGKKHELHKAKLVLLDEAHCMKGSVAQEVIQRHLADGAWVVGITATPVDMPDCYKELLEFVDNDDLRQLEPTPAHLWAEVYAPWEIDAQSLKEGADGSISEQKVRSVYPLKQIVGHVVPYYNEVNPDRLPTLLFAPGVKESKWFAEHLTKDHGIPAAHIDGMSCWVDGEDFKSDIDKRNEILDRLRSGDIKVVCNRFVLREGVDVPEIGHMILATTFGSLQSYIQSVGRGLRYHKSIVDARPPRGRVTICDHGGNYWRYGSPNASRQWADYWQSSSAMASLEYIEKTRSGEQKEALVCPECGAVWDPAKGGFECYKCGRKQKTYSRKVLQKSGKLIPVTGPAIRKRPVRLLPDTEKLWERQVHRFRRTKRTWRQAYANFNYENGYYPPRDLPMMPTTMRGWFQEVRNTDMSTLKGSS